MVYTTVGPNVTSRWHTYHILLYTYINIYANICVFNLCGFKPCFCIIHFMGYDNVMYVYISCIWWLAVHTYHTLNVYRCWINMTCMIFWNIIYVRNILENLLNVIFGHKLNYQMIHKKCKYTKHFLIIIK